MKAVNFASLCWASLASGAILRMPITGHLAVASPDNTKKLAKRQEQITLQYPPKQIDNQAVGALPLDSRAGLFAQILSANISIGTPPQFLAVTLDTFSPDPLFVPGKECKNQPYDFDGCGEDFWPRFYNSSRSSTHRPIGGDFHTDFGGYSFQSKQSQDVIRLGDIELDRGIFNEWRTAHCTFVCNPGAQFGYDGVLGLAPPGVRSDAGWNLLNQLENSIAIDERKFSIMLPRPNGEPGEVNFGGAMPPVYAGEPLRIPLKRQMEGYRAFWPLDFMSLHWNDTAKPINATFEAHPALIASSSPYIVLPPGYGDALVEAMGDLRQFAMFRTLPCERRATLPALRFGLGPDNEVLTLTGYDYVQEIHDLPEPGSPSFCALMIDDGGEYGFGENVMILGVLS